MWTVYSLASKYNRLPSEIIDEEHKLDSLTRYIVNKVVTLFGMTIDNALHEMVDVGTGANKHSERKYDDVNVLLDPAFRLPRPQSKAKLQMDTMQAFMAMASQKDSGVKVWGYTGNDVKPS